MNQDVYGSYIHVHVVQSDLTTLTYIELEHAQPNQHVVLLGEGLARDMARLLCTCSLVPMPRPHKVGVAWGRGYCTCTELRAHAHSMHARASGKQGGA